MEYLERISAKLSNNKIQRILYTSALICWTLLWTKNWELYNSESSLGIRYIWIWSIPTILLSAQIILNRKILWILIWFLVLLYTIFTIYELTLHFIIYSEREYIKNIFNLETVVGLTVTVLVLFTINWTLFKMKPRKSI